MRGLLTACLVLCAAACGTSRGQLESPQFEVTGGSVAITADGKTTSFERAHVEFSPPLETAVDTPKGECDVCIIGDNGTLICYGCVVQPPKPKDPPKPRPKLPAAHEIASFDQSGGQVAYDENGDALFMTLARTDGNTMLCADECYVECSCGGNCCGPCGGCGEACAAQCGKGGGKGGKGGGRLPTKQT